MWRANDRRVVVLWIAGCAAVCPAQRSANDGAAIARAGALYRSGTAAFQAGDLPKAHADFASLVQQTPRAWAAHTAYGDVLLAEGAAAAAVAQFQESLRLHGDAQTMVNLAMAQHALQHEQEAVAAFRMAMTDTSVRLTPLETAAYAAALFSVGDRTGAEDTLHAPLKGTAIDAAGRALLLDTLGMVQAQSNRMDEARDSFQRSLAANGSLASAHAHLGSAELALNNPRAALPEFEAALQLGDHTPATLVQLGRAQFALADYDAAIATEKQALQQAPAMFEAQYALALALQAASRIEESLPLFAEAARARPKDTQVLTNYGLALVQAGNAKGALLLYERALAAGDGSPTLHENTGVAYLQQNNIDAAIEQFQAGLKTDPQNVQLHYDLGLAYKLKDNVPASTAELRRAEELDPQLPDPFYTLGVLEMQGGNFREAGAQLEHAVALQPANGEAWSLLGSVYKQAGDASKSAEALRRAIQLQPAQPSPHVTLAAVLAESGDREGAAEERKIAAALSRVAVSHQRAEFSLNSGRALLAQGKIPEALVQFQAAVNAEPDSPITHLAMADALTKAGRMTEASAERDRAGMLARSPAQSKP